MGLNQDQKSKLFLVVLAVAMAVAWWFGRATPERIIAGLADPEELATLGERGANPRVNELVFWLNAVELEGKNVTNVLAVVLRDVYPAESQRQLVQTALLRNLTIAHRLGLLTETNQNLEQLQRGRSPTITSGPYTGEKTEVDHIVPRSLAPETDNELANLELMPTSLNRKKSNRVNSRHVSHAEKLFQAGLLTVESLERVKTQARLNPAAISDL